MNYWTKKSNYKEERNYNKTQQIKKYNPSTRKAEELDLTDYLNSFNEYKITEDKNKVKNLDTLKNFRKTYTENVNIENMKEETLTKKEQAQKFRELADKLETEETEE